MASGSDDLLTIHSNNTTERVRVNNSGDVIVGSGVTLSPDGDIFFTGIATGNGSGLTNLATDLVNDTSPQLGGNLDVNTKNILLGDSSDGSSDDVLIFGADSDLKIFHNSGEDQIQSTASRLEIRSDSLRLISSAAEKYFMGTSNGSAALYHDGTKQCETSASGLAFPSGKGIDFSATANGGSGTPSEIFDDYEEGTWTPTVNGIASPNYTIQVGRYTKIGNLVNAQAYLLLYSGGGEGSNFRIASLPFTSTSTGYHDGGGYVTYENGFFSTTAGSAGATCTVWVPGNNTVIEFHERNSGNNIQGNSTNFGLGANNKYLVVQVQYVVA